MQEVLLQIIEHTKTRGEVSAKELQEYMRAYNRTLKEGQTPAAKRRLLSIYLTVKNKDKEQFESWGLSAEDDRNILKTLRIKPRRTASGVATIAVITKPWTCSSNCLYCPNDIRMPKSYLYDEPACQRAEHNFFDPYLQVSARLNMLRNMGHVIDKIEFIVLGGTWTDYPQEYQTWFIKEMFKALNDSDETRTQTYMDRVAFYEKCGLTSDPDLREKHVEEDQLLVNDGIESFNEAINKLYKRNLAWKNASEIQTATPEEVYEQHKINETAQHRVVGLVVETQPDKLTPDTVRRLRRLGCTKAQIGVQTLNQDILDVNQRKIKVEEIAHAFELLRLYGFKIHAHFMANLYKATPEMDKVEFNKFVTGKSWQPDEIKLYPCALIYGAALVRKFEEGTWKPYTHEELMDVLVYDTLITPPFIRISRMIREFASPNIVDGNRKVNLRELVEIEARKSGKPVQEIRFREINNKEIDPDTLILDVYPYETTSTSERFLQWITPGNKIAGFTRLSMPNQDYVKEHLDELEVGLGEAMIREVHVYGRVAKLGKKTLGAQHMGLGRQLIYNAATIAKDNGYTKLNVISSVGTREYYRGLGFEDGTYYQQLDLENIESIVK